jgi:hypothetical protein
MTIYTVHLPQTARDDDTIARELRLVPERGSFLAFIFSFLWLMTKGAWLAALVWLALSALVALFVPAMAAAAILVLLQLLLALEGHQFVRLSLSHGRWRMVDVVQAASFDEAERIALSRLISRSAAPSLSPAQRLPVADLGLFPGTGGWR